MTPFEIIAYLQDNPITSALIPILKANYIWVGGNEIEWKGMESFVFYQQNQLPNGRKKTIKNKTKEIISEQISYKRIDNEDNSLIYWRDGLYHRDRTQLIKEYNYNGKYVLNDTVLWSNANSVRAWIDEDEYSDTYGKKFLIIRFQSIELTGDTLDEQGGISLFSPSPISLEDYYYNIDNSWLKFNSWAQWDSYYSKNYLRLEYVGLSIPSLNNPPR